MALTFTQRKQLYDDGYVQISGAIPRLMVDEALRAINHSLGEGIPPEQIDKFRSQSYCPEVQRTPAITDLFHKSPVKDLVGSVIDIERIDPIRGGQIALRFPASDAIPRAAHPHIDGMYTANNGVQKGTISNFTALAGVILSNLSDDNAGNFTVWPKTHHLFEKYFQEHGAEALLNGMPPVDMPEPVQIKGKPGDIILAHYLLAHGVTPNISAQIRYAVFFRIKHADITESNWRQSMKNMWMHWPGMQDLLIT